MERIDDGDIIAKAYGLLWLFNGDAHCDADRRVFEARKLLLSLLTKGGQRRGIEAAKVFEDHGLRLRNPPTADVLRALLMKCHQWINPHSDPLHTTSRELLAEIEAAIRLPDDRMGERPGHPSPEPKESEE